MAHQMMNKIYGRPQECEGKNCKGTSKRYEWASVRKIYTTDRNEWKRLCRSCHIRYDRKTAPGRYKALEGGRGPKSEETKLHISEALKGRELSEQHKKKIGKALEGREYSVAYKEKMSESLKGRKIKWKKKIAAGMRKYHKRRKKNVD